MRGREVREDVGELVGVASEDLGWGGRQVNGGCVCRAGQGEDGGVVWGGRGEGEEGGGVAAAVDYGEGAGAGGAVEGEGFGEEGGVGVESVGGGGGEAGDYRSSVASRSRGNHSSSSC